MANSSNNVIEPQTMMNVVGEITNPTLPPPPHVAIRPNSSMTPSTNIELVEAITMDEFWAGLDDLGVGSFESASTNFHISFIFFFLFLLHSVLMTCLMRAMMK
ncbi:transmembrane protein, putative [Medicago truncatula]|nr:transmembrane protein, putative [Medicago truncatula]